MPVPRLHSRLVIPAAGLLPLVLSMPTPAAAQDAPPRFELTPFFGYRIGGGFDAKDGGAPSELADSRSVGLIFNIRQQADTQWEISYDHEEAELRSAKPFAAGSGLELDIDSLQFGGTYEFDAENARPFVAATVGVTRFAPVRSAFDAESYFSASIGGGIELRTERPVGIRLDARVRASLIATSGGIFCGSFRGAGVCAIHVEGRALYQWEARAGVVFRF